ncbi:MAG: hypothetical protein HQ546_06635 [Planctomycetes bacterium]|nr:hypothetical protein [Planctomycetota bacterium]
MKPTVKTIASQPSWVIRSKQVELAVTQLGGHMAPVTFYRNAGPVQPYYISPWQYEKREIADPVLRPARGDFFCMPFGANGQTYRGETHLCHGEPASAKWNCLCAARCGGVTSVTLRMKTKVRPGEVTKTLSLVDGHNVVYCRQVLEGFSGKMPLGHHAILSVREKEGSLRVASSKFRFGMTAPSLFANPADREYQSFAVNKTFRDLSRVPLLWKDPPYGDCTAFPARTGFVDLLSVFKTPGDTPAWMTATDSEQGYLWFSLKDPAVLPATVMWISNHGRHGAPWDGRNRCLGIEDVCAHFADGLAASARPNVLTAAGVPTVINLSAKRPTAVNFIQGLTKVPRGFTTVEAVEFAPGTVTFVSPTGKRVTAEVNHEFLQTGRL